MLFGDGKRVLSGAFGSFREIAAKKEFTCMHNKTGSCEGNYRDGQGWKHDMCFHPKQCFTMERIARAKIDIGENQ